MVRTKHSWRVLAVTGMLTLLGGLGLAQEEGPVVEVVDAQAAALEAGQIQAYWTPERLENAIPMPLPTVIDGGAGLAPLIQEPAAQLTPGYAPGWSPASGLAPPGPEAAYSVELSDGSDPELEVLYQHQDGPKPNNPRDGPYGPFQRYTHFGKYLTYPRSVIGKYFFTLNGSNFVCSASVINRNTLITAGHCNSDGSGTFATNRLFCPSYNAGGVNPSRGCWSVIGSVVSNPWHNGGDPDYDYSCLITAATGTIINNRVGNVTGWAGRAWNWSARQATMSFGYPAGAPFVGVHIIHVAGPEWYEHDFRAGAQISKLMGNDMTGGSSGGPWILGWNHRTAEYADTDGASATDPGSQWVNGVNSHKRCRTNCNSPPTTTSGVFWQEMSSPPFRSDANDANDSEDVIGLCFANGGT